MPVVPTLTPNVGLDVGRPRVAPDAISLEAAGGGENGRGNNLIKLGEVISAAAIEQQAKINQANVMRATADLTLQFNENMRAQYQKFGLNALGKPATDKSEAVPSASEDFSNFAQTTLQSAMGNMDNDLQRQKLQEWYNDNFPGYLQKVATHQNNQYNEYLTESLNTQQKANMDTFVGMVKLGDYQGAEHAFNNANNWLQEYLTWQGADDKTRKKATQDMLYSNAESTVKALLDDNRAQEAYAFVNHFAPRMTPNQVETLRMAIRPTAVKVQADVIAEDMFKDPSLRGPDGSLDAAKVDAAVNKITTVTKTVGGTFNTNDPRVQEIYSEAVWAANQLNVPVQVLFAQWGFESSSFGSRLARENNNLAGLTQVEPNGEENKQPEPGATNYYKQYANVHEFAQDYVNFIKNGYSSAMGQQTVEGYVTALKNGGYFTKDLNTYLSGVQSVYNDFAGSYADGQQVTERNEVMADEIRARLKELEQQEKLNYSARVNAAADAMAQASQSGQIQTLDDARRIGTQVSGTHGIKPSDVMGVINIGTSAVGLQNRITAEERAEEYDNAIGELMNGNVLSESELRVRFPNLTNAQRQQLVSSFISPKYKWANDQTKSMVDATIERSGFSLTKDKLQKVAVYQYVNDKVKMYVDKNGHSPSIWEIQDFAIEATHNAALVSYQDKGRFYDSTETTDVTNAQFAGLNIHPRTVNGELKYYDDAGQEWEYNPVWERFEKVQH